MTSDSAKDKMLSDPDSFFKYYPVKSFGGPPPFTENAETIKSYRVSRVASMKDGGKLGHQGATRPGTTLGFTKKNISSFKLQPNGQQGAGDNSAAFDTCGVPMVNYNSDIYGAKNLHGNIAAMKYYIAGAGAYFMTTGQLSGCCFTWVAVAGALYCVHIQPKGLAPNGAEITGGDLQLAVRTTGHFEGFPRLPLKTFGRENLAMGHAASIIGVKSNGMWKLYAQISADGFNKIYEVWQLHPGAPRQIR